MLPGAAAHAEALVVLRNTRRLRRVTLFCFGAPVVVTATLVLLNKLTNGGMHFFVNGDPWTHWFWSGLFYMLMAGAVCALLTLARICPRCRNGFHHRRGYDPKHPPAMDAAGARFNVNILSRRCVNCGLRDDGADLTHAAR